MVQIEVHGRGVVRGIVHDDASVSGNAADVRERHLLALAQVLEQHGARLLEQQRVVLLVLGAPDLEHRESLVTYEHIPNPDPCAGRADDLLQHVAVAARSLVVDAHDRIVGAQLHACADHPVHLLLHLGIAALHRVEIQLRHVLALHHARGRAAPHPDSVGRSAQLHDQHLGLRLSLLGVPRVYLADAAREHDRLDPLAPLFIGEPHPEGARVALDQRLAELVAVVGSAVGGLDLDLEWRGEVAGILEGGVLPRQLVARDAQVPHAVGRRASHIVGTASRGVHVADPPAAAGLRARKRRHSGWEVVGLGGEDDVVVEVRRDER